MARRLLLRLKHQNHKQILHQIIRTNPSKGHDVIFKNNIKPLNFISAAFF
jgi:hypothetical protein